MLRLRFSAFDSVVLWCCGRVVTLTRENRPCDDTTLVFCLRKPRVTGTHGIYIETFAGYDSKGQPYILLSSDSAVHVQHSSMAGTNAGVEWKKPRR